MFKINTNMNATIAQNRLLAASADVAKRLERLSTGLRINAAGDDAAGLSASETMRAQLVGQQVAAENASRAIALLQTADNGLQQIGDILIRLKELATQAADSTLSDDNRSGVSAEATGLMSEIVRISTVTAFNGITLINSSGAAGAGTNLTFFIGDGTSTTGQTVSLEISGVRFSTAGLGSINNTGVNITVANFGFVGSADDLLAEINTGVDALNIARGNIGATQNRMERTLGSIQTAAEATQNSISTIRDADFATEAAGLTRAQILVQAGTSMLAQANVLPQSVLLLLTG